MIALDRRTVAVTGASGFIGTRTVEYLALATRARVRALVRSFSALSRLSELPQEQLSFERADVLDRAALDRAFAGCDVVVHCAFGSDGDAETQWRTTVEGTRNAVDAALRAGVGRFVHLGTAALYDIRGRDAFDERTPRLARTVERTYEQAKLAAEEIVFGSGLDAVALQPTIVYGPWGKDWTARTLARLAAGTRGLPAGDDTGVCNAVYVDDVARAIVRACAPGPAAGAVLVSGGESLTWGRFYDAFRELAGGPAEGDEGPAVEPWEAELYAERAVASIDKASATLGFVPSVGFTEGMRAVAAWVRWLG